LIEIRRHRPQLGVAGKYYLADESFLRCISLLLPHRGCGPEAFVGRFRGIADIASRSPGGFYEFTA
jgi:hypothetical protein